ncbi:aminotransferase class I/II-fold pyridoxal phosphate-dependent enzyme [Agrobacterium salinitolerans]|uniref:aminotransferase class I/II-fold pyridoxal phosphate-dependent enzyme n=1 Tax=Agrobacterium salinitolerans TaxID=1183413 RepID=UPI0015719950|nr:aminotransferase class I/II-fold pyridoxal phosphate-dependent enzyme [Agrobacterium salinitolerans]
MRLPFIQPNPPRLSQSVGALETLERSGIYSNFGPQNTLFEKQLVEKLMAGSGHSLTVCNATIGLMLAIKEAITIRGNAKAKYALVPSFTFAATPHAAMWCGLTPILYDIDPKTWLPSTEEEERILDKFHEEIAVVVPYATFGNCLDMDRYNTLAQSRGIPVVVDAAASLGSKDSQGHGFGTGSAVSVVYSMHVTKTFSTSEGGVIYSADQERINRIRLMSNYGFSEPRAAGMPGLNAKLSEVAALIALQKLASFDDVLNRRETLYQSYYHLLADVVDFQVHVGQSVASQFVPVLLPLNRNRDDVINYMVSHGVSVGKYFSPHIAEQPYFRDNSLAEPLIATNDVASRIVCLPIYDSMLDEELHYVAATLRECLTR